MRLLEVYHHMTEANRLPTPVYKWHSFHIPGWSDEGMLTVLAVISWWKWELSMLSRKLCVYATFTSLVILQLQQMKYSILRFYDSFCRRTGISWNNISISHRWLKVSCVYYWIARRLCGLNGSTPFFLINLSDRLPLGWTASLSPVPLVTKFKYV